MKTFRAALTIALFALVAACGNKSGSVAFPAAATSDAEVVAQDDQQPISEAEARKVVEAAQAAAAKNDVHASAAHFSEDFVFESTMRQPSGETETKVRTKSEFIALELGALEKAKAVRYSSAIEQVTVAADGKSAEVHVSSDTQTEMDGHALQMSAQEIMTVARRGGRPMIIATRLKATGMTVNGVKIY